MQQPCYFPWGTVEVDKPICRHRPCLLGSPCSSWALVGWSIYLLPLQGLQPLRSRLGLGAPRGPGDTALGTQEARSPVRCHQPDLSRGAGDSGLSWLGFATTVYICQQRKGAYSLCHDVLCAFIIYCHNCSRRFFLMLLCTPPD